MFIYIFHFLGIFSVLGAAGWVVECVLLLKMWFVLSTVR